MDYKSIENLKNKKKFSLLGSLSLIFWIFVVFLVILKVVVFQQVSVVGSSMEPNYSNGQTLFMNQLSKDYSRGQVVAVFKDFQEARNADYFTRFQSTFYLKRIIALPNESIEIIGGKVILYSQTGAEGKILEENYVTNETKSKLDQENYHLPKLTLKSNEYFLMGDNRTNSYDSRLIGPFPDYAIFGQETLRVWPLQTIEIFNLPKYSFTELDKNTLLKREALQITSGNVDFN